MKMIEKTVITLVTTPGTEFRTGKSNDLVILKNLEKHDIFLDFSFIFKSKYCFIASELSKISIKIKFFLFSFDRNSTFRIRFNVTSGINTLHLENYSYVKNSETNTGNDIFLLRSTIENNSPIKYVV